MNNSVINHKNNTLYYLLLIFVCLAGLSATLYVWLTINASMKQSLTDRAKTYAAVMDVQKISTLSGSALDLVNPDYDSIKQDLKQIAAANHDVRFIYLMGRTDGGRLFFYADSEDPSSPDYSAPGDEFPEASPLMSSVFDKKESIYEISPDRWGWWISSYAPILDQNGNVLALVGVDIPAYQNLLTIAVYSSLPILMMLIIILFIIASHNIQKKDERYIEQKAEFLSVASHEIRSPLTGIRWATELLLKKDLADDIKSTLNTIHENSIELIKRIGFMLDTDVTDSEDLKRQNMKQADLSQIVEEIKKTLTLTAASKEVNLVVDQSVSKDTILCCNYESMRQMLANLMSNAIKYTRRGTNVTISHSYQNFIHKIYIKDEGAGISPEDQTKIFEGHRTLSAIASDEVGNGLGLYFSQKIAKLHNGKIEVESKPGEGSTFILTLNC